MEEEENDNILYTGRDIPTPTTCGSTTRTYTHQKFLKNTSHIPLRLDDQMFKRRHLNINSFSILPLNTMTMSSAYSPTASIYDYPSCAISPLNASQKDHQLPPISMSPPPICVINPFPDQTTSHSPLQLFAIPNDYRLPSSLLELVTKNVTVNQQHMQR